MTPQPRILWNAKDAPWLNSGYGIITRYLTPLLAERYGPDNVLILAPVYQKDSVGEYQGMKVLPGISWDFGEEVLLDHYRTYGCNMLLQVGDAWPLGLLPDMAAQDRVLWVHWLPVDWLGMPKNIQNRIRYAHKLIPFSKDGEARLRQAGFNVEPAIWLGLDLTIWHPRPRADLPKVMMSLGFQEDTFNILLVGANQERKRLRHQLEGVHLFSHAFPQANPRLYLHSMIKGERDLAADLDELDLAGITVSPDQYLMAQGGFPEDIMAAIYNCADVVLNCCMEGFGLSHIQGQACGVPVIYLNEGPGAELVPFGVGVPPLAVETIRNQMAQPTPNPLGIAEALAYQWRRRLEEGRPRRSEKAAQFVKENFSWEKIAQQWFGVIEKVMGDVEKYCYQVPEPGQELVERAKRLVEVG